MKKIYLIRHGESVGNAGKSTVDHRSMPLTEKGWAQARALAEKIDVVPELIVVSSFTRAQQTAKPMQEKFPDVSVETWSEAYEFTYLAPDSCRNTTAEERLLRVMEYWERLNPDYIDGEGAESFYIFVRRAEITLNKLRQRPEKTIFLFSHAQFIAGLSLLAEDKGASGSELMMAFRKMPLLHNTEYQCLCVIVV